MSDAQRTRSRIGHGKIGRAVNTGFPDNELDKIRRDLIARKEKFGMSDAKLRDDIHRQLKYEIEDELQLDRKTLERFLKNIGTTNPATVGIYKHYIESIPDPDPAYELGDAFADYFGLPESAKERRAYMDRMAEMYEGRYNVWDATDGTPNEHHPDWRLIIKSQPYTSFLHATEDETGMQRSRAPFKGIVIPREKELTIFMKEEMVDHEKIYVLRLVDPEERSSPNPPTAFFGNVMEKKLAVERENEPKEDLTRHFKVLAIRAPEYDDDGNIVDDGTDQNIAVSDAPDGEEILVETFELGETESNEFKSLK